jgi:DNA (cytosine-5)-methyltransferase 1
MTAPAMNPTPPDFHRSVVFSGARPPIGLTFYSGAMGFDLGLERGAGVQFLLAADSMAAARATIRANRPGIPVLADARISAAQARKAAGLGPNDVIDIVAGCPPCPPWSVAGKRRGVNDPRGKLLPRFIDLAIDLRPRLIVHENVKGLASAELGGEKGGLLKLLIYELRRNGYRVACEVVNAADFGAPQDRERLILIACLDADPALPDPTHSRDGSGGLPKWRTLRDAVRGLPPRPCDHLEYSPKMLRYMSRLKAGQCWKHLPVELQREAVPYMGRWGGGGTGTLRRLSWDRPCPTVTCSPAQKMTTLGHPDEDRPLSVQECMRVQGFPDDWRIMGSTAERHVQVGNAVPVQLSTAVGRAVAATLGLRGPEVTEPRPAEVPTAGGNALRKEGRP